MQIYSFKNIRNVNKIICTLHHNIIFYKTRGDLPLFAKWLTPSLISTCVHSIGLLQFVSNFSNYCDKFFFLRNNSILTIFYCQKGNFFY